MQEVETTKKTATIIPECLEMLREAMEYISEDSLRQAEIMHEQFYDKVKKIEQMPGIGTKYQNDIRKTGLGKFRRYNIYYREKENKIEILGIWHTSRGVEFTEPDV